MKRRRSDDSEPGKREEGDEPGGEGGGLKRLQRSNAVGPLAVRAADVEVGVRRAVSTPTPSPSASPAARIWDIDPAKGHTTERSASAPPTPKTDDGGGAGAGGGGGGAGAGGAGAGAGAGAEPDPGTPAASPTDDPCGVEWHTESWMGLKKTQEDRAANGRGRFMSSVLRFHAVYDGHGGAECSDFLLKRLHGAILHSVRQLASASKSKHPSRQPQSALSPRPPVPPARAPPGPPVGPTEEISALTPSQERHIALYKSAITSAFQAVDNDFLAVARRKSLPAGSTALVALLTGSSVDDLTLFVANTGDCRAVLCRGGVTVRLSDDHKPNRSDERARISKAGGHVVQLAGVWRVTSPARVHGRRTLLSVSRTFGDVQLKEPKPLVICRPDIRAQPLHPDDMFLVLACDGVWDVMSDDDAVAMVLESNLDPVAAATLIVRTAYQRRSEDNLTATVIKLPGAGERLEDALAARKAAVKAAEAAAEEEVDMFA